VKTRLHQQIKAINIQLYKETQNPIYLWKILQQYSGYFRKFNDYH
jgi:hypothetical protein